MNTSERKILANFDTIEMSDQPSLMDSSNMGMGFHQEVLECCSLLDHVHRLGQRRSPSQSLIAIHAQVEVRLEVQTPILHQSTSCLLKKSRALGIYTQAQAGAQGGLATCPNTPEDLTLPYRRRKSLSLFRSATVALICQTPTTAPPSKKKKVQRFLYSFRHP
nr:hypothetical protein Iba_chr13fCG9330 [Ipomoea batatas]